MLIESSFINVNMARTVGAICTKRENGDLVKSSISMKIGNKKVENIIDFRKALEKSKKSKNEIQFFMERKLVISFDVQIKLGLDDEVLLDYLFDFMDEFTNMGDKTGVSFAILISEIITNSNFEHYVKAEKCI